MLGVGFELTNFLTFVFPRIELYPELQVTTRLIGQGISLETNISVKNRDFELHHEHCLSKEPANGEGRCPGDEMTVVVFATGKRGHREAREPKTWIL